MTARKRRGTVLRRGRLMLPAVREFPAVTSVGPIQQRSRSMTHVQATLQRRSGADAAGT